MEKRAGLCGEHRVGWSGMGCVRESQANKLDGGERLRVVRKRGPAIKMYNRMGVIDHFKILCASNDSRYT